MPLELPTVDHAEVVVDGEREPAWDSALVVEEWVVYHPAPDGVPQTHAVTELLADPQGLYLFWRVVDPEPELVRARLSQRDELWGDDAVGIYLDPAGDGQRAYLFIANALGVQADAVRVANQDDSFSWDGQWDSAGRLTDDGYQVEMFIPWDTVRHPADMEQVGVSLLRFVGRTGERAAWPRRDPAVSGIIVQQNLLRGPGPVGKNRGLMLIPSLTTGFPVDDRRLGLGPAAPGVTLRYDPGPALSLLATANPDFSQVEADVQQIDVNQRYPLYLSERRPFFQEGQEWLEPGGPDLLYTRSIVTPRYGVRATSEVGGWKLAALHALDATPAPSVNEGGGWTEQDMAGQMALVTVARARRGFGADSGLGVFYSDKTLTGGELSNRLGAVDGALRLSDSSMLRFALFGSQTTLAGQQPLTRGGASLSVEQSATHHELGAFVAARPPGLFAENGFLTRTDLVGAGTYAMVKAYPRGGFVRSVAFIPFEVDASWRFSTGDLRDLSIGPVGTVRFANSTSLTFGAWHTEEVLGEAWLEYADGMVSVGGAPSRWLSGNLGVRGGESPYYQDPHVGNYGSVFGSLTLRPDSHVLLGLSGSAVRFSSPHAAYSGWVSRARVEAYVSRELWARLLWDHNSFQGLHAGTALLAWQVSPGRAVYLGTAVTHLPDQPMEWQAFAKASWVFML